MTGKTENDSFIQATARDYDMEPWEVMHIYNLSEDGDGGNRFYEELEEFIKQRANAR